MATRFSILAGKIPARQGSQAGYSPQCCKELDVTEHIYLSNQDFFFTQIPHPLDCPLPLLLPAVILRVTSQDRTALDGTHLATEGPVTGLKQLCDPGSALAVSGAPFLCGHFRASTTHAYLFCPFLLSLVQVRLFLPSAPLINDRMLFLSGHQVYPSVNIYLKLKQKHNPPTKPN